MSDLTFPLSDPVRDSLVRKMSPRPFPLHMLLSMSALLSSKSGSPHWSAASLKSAMKDGPVGASWSRADLKLPSALAAQIARLDPSVFEQALDRQIVAVASDYADGLAAYRNHDYRRPAEIASVIWRRGAAELLDHGVGAALDAIPILFAPSLINRGWILDLMPGRGMLSWLSAQGLHPYRIEWGAPQDDERRFGVADYVRQRLEPAIDHIVARSGRPLVLAGYCMGGLLAMAAAIRRPDAIAALALLAMPWDFHAAGVGAGADADRARAMAALYRSYRPFLDGVMPIDAIQALFTAHDPIVSLRKFRRFAALDPASPDADAFVALEDWLNDGVALPLPVADEALLDWYGANATGLGNWRIDGVTIRPAALSMPTIVVVPGSDRIVPPASAAAIIPYLERGSRLDPALGHIGMVVGRNAQHALWRPLAEWIKQFGA